jgi:hypothetical protein
MPKPIALAIAAFLVSGSFSLPNAHAAAYENTVSPILIEYCYDCHGDGMDKGNVTFDHFSSDAQRLQDRKLWAAVLKNVRAQLMPPAKKPRPSDAQVAQLEQWIKYDVFGIDPDHPDPGRTTLRRLNRNEYQNTVRDLMGIEFKAYEEFPPDDTGYGFDNIADVLTVSPILMEKYIEAAESIASRAIGANPLPKKPLEADYHVKHRTIRRVDFSTIEAVHPVEWDGEYIIRIGLPGDRGPDAKPVIMGFWMDGKLLHSMEVQTKPSGLVYFSPYSSEEFRLVLREGEHVFRAGFINDDFPKGLTRKEAYSSKTNKYLESITFIGPFPARVEKASRKKILICDPNTGAACVDTIVSTLARRAYRRPVTKSEAAALTRFVDLAKAEGQSVEQGIQLAIQAMLVSPHFLFRIERDPDTAGSAGVHRISDLELASRLGYFLWSSMPDDELLSLAEAGKLRAPGVLDAQVTRMLADARSAALADNFAGQWLETRNLDVVKPDPQKFPDWGPDLRDAMKRETSMFFEHMLRENRPLYEFLDANYTFVNDRLARHYEIEGIAGPEFRRVEYPDARRGGILSHGSVLTVSSYPTRTSPVIRGKYVLQNILGAPPPPPPPDVPALDEEAVGNSGSMRQQLEKHRTNAVCASCHARMDVLGFGLENFDAVGKWRTTDGKFPVDVSGTLPNGKSFTTPAEMRALLKAELPEVSRSVAEKMLTYALGRGLERHDRPTVSGIAREVARSDYRMQTLVREIVNSAPFQFRRVENSRSDSSTNRKEVARR